MARPSPSRSARALSAPALAAPESFDRLLRESGVACVRRPRLPSLAMRIARVATGECDVALARENSYDWDIAAADLILHEAGGVLTDWHGTRAVLQSRDAKTSRPGGGTGRPAGPIDRGHPRLKKRRRYNRIGMEMRMSHEVEPKQLLHLVFGGELQNLATTDFKESEKLDLVGMYPDYKIGPCGLESQGAIDRGQCADALFHRPSPSRDGPIRRLIAGKAAQLAPRPSDLAF